MEKEKRLLEVGDKVWCNDGRYGGTSYITSEVVKITKNFAILKDGEKLRHKEPRVSYDEVTSDSWHFRRWQLLTTEMGVTINKHQLEKKKVSWFNNQSFTNEQKISIYDMFNNENTK